MTENYYYLSSRCKLIKILLIKTSNTYIRKGILYVDISCGQSTGRMFVRARDISLFRTASGAHLASYTMANGGCFPMVKRLGREAEDLPPSRAEVTNDGDLPSLSYKSLRRGA
jgi:hypothetical protein